MAKNAQKDPCPSSPILQPLRCIYCAAPADSVEHIVPVSFFGLTRKQGEQLYPKDLPTFHACRECNSMLNRCQHTSIAERAAVLESALRRKYRGAISREVGERINNVRFWAGQEPIDIAADLDRKWETATAESSATKKKVRKCSECGAALKPTARRFCSRPCGAAWHKRLRDRGVQVLSLLVATRKNRKGNHTIGHVNSLLANWFAEDMAAGRETYHPEMVPADVKVALTDAWYTPKAKGK